MKLGLKRGTVALEQYDPEWIRAFESEKVALEKLLGDNIFDIEHIGSTSIPGLTAKPIIDMLIGMKSMTDLPKLESILERAGYEYRPNGSDEFQALFVSGPEELRTHYLHFTEVGSSTWRDDLAFRDYLRTHPEARIEYENLKKGLAAKYKDDRVNYTASKEEFIKGILAMQG
jgi:GrpB-like predicted nucleotidyltransferase (UPF0157 family)